MDASYSTPDWELLSYWLRVTQLLTESYLTPESYLTTDWELLNSWLRVTQFLTESYSIPGSEFDNSSLPVRTRHLESFQLAAPVSRHGKWLLGSECSRAYSDQLSVQWPVERTVTSWAYGNQLSVRWPVNRTVTSWAYSDQLSVQWPVEHILVQQLITNKGILLHVAANCSK